MIKFILIITILFVNNILAKDDKVSLQLQWKHAFQFAGYYIAKEKGFYKDVGIDLEIKEYQYGIDSIDDILNNNSTYGVGRPSIIIDKAEGKDIVLLAAIYQSSPLIVLTIEQSAIKDINDFKNKTIMTLSDSSNDAAINAMLKSQKLSLENMNVIKHSFDVKDLINGKTDLITAYIADQPYKLKKLGYKPKIFHPRDYGFDFYSDILFTSRNELKQYPQRVGHFKSASLKGWRYAFDNINETVDIILDKYNTQNLSKEALIYEANELKKLAFFDTDELGKMENKKLVKILGLYNLLGTTHGVISLEKCIYVDENKKNQEITLKEKQYLKEKGSISMCIDPKWMPFEQFNQNGEYEGISKEYFDIFKKQLEIPIDIIKTTSWNETLDFAKKRKCDIISMAMETPARKQYMNFTMPYLSIPLVMATKNDVSFIDNIHDLGDKKVGIVEGYALEELFKLKYKNLNIIDVKDTKEGLEKVSDGELFGFLGSIADIGYIFQTNYIGNLKITGKFYERWELGVAVRSDDLILLSIFNKMIAGIDYGKRQDILHKYIAIKYEKGIDYTLLWKTSIGFIFAIIIMIFFLFRQNRLKKEIENLNKNLEMRIHDEVEKNRQKDQTIYRQSKLASMGEMIANIAHQWRQPLNRVNLSLGVIYSIITDDIIDKELIIKKIETSQKNLCYMSDTIEDFANFFRPDKERKEFYIKNVHESIIKLLDNKLDGISFNYDDKNEIKIKSYENELLQVFIIIINNALDNFIIREIKNPRIDIFIKSKKDTIEIDIFDNGGGIPSENIDKVFDPYFTTKFKSEGTGIGLYMAKMIIEDSMDGKLLLKVIGNETIFSIKLKR